MDWKYLFLSFEGRINRQPFWICVLVFLAVNIVVGIVDMILGGTGVFSGIVSLVLIYPGIAVSAKRWHDRNKSAWWILISLVPIIGWIWALIETGFLPGTPGENRFGADPLT